MSFFRTILMNLPEVEGPTQRKLSFKEKLKWTGIILVTFFVLGFIPLFGLGQNSLEQFEFLSVILGAEFGSIISLGIGPIVTASIVLQLLNGSGILKFDLRSEEGKKTFQGIQKLLSIFFILFEAAIYVFMGGLAPDPALKGSLIFLDLELIIIFQMFLGGVAILFMDEIVSKWGFGSGVSLFIAAGVSKTLFIRTFSPLPSPTNPEFATGAIPVLFQSLASGASQMSLLMVAGIISTIIVFVIAVYSQAMKVEIPLSFGRIRGHGIRWPLSFIYTSNIPVILVAALLANIQLWARLLETWLNWSGAQNIVAWVSVPGGNEGLLGAIIRQGSIFIGWKPYAQGLVYMIIMIIGAVIFSWFWVQTAGMDAKTQAKNIISSGLQVPGFRKDERVMERLLDRYIGPLTVMGAITIGFLAAVADLSGSLVQGTSLLLTVMIVYRLYEDIAKQHMYDMHPMMRKFMEI
ncbi:MAG TPA: preprotein translocase subunit SecY [Candidatus Nanoarchaeia archaeon]|nr:preprotein translocase subunit SecY [Candidatus Nanoarchaeia archaeon]